MSTVYTRLIKLRGLTASFQPISLQDVITAMCQLLNKLSELVDPIPVDILNQVTGEIAPCFRELFNRSFSVGEVPATFESAYVTTSLLSLELDAVDMQSNLSEVSGQLKQLVTQQLIGYLGVADLLPSFQSAYRSCHSTETVVLFLLSEILMTIDHVT